MQDIINRHLKNILQEHLADNASTSGNTAETGNIEMERRTNMLRLQTAAPQLADALSDLLGRYVHLLESTGHGGWTQEEDQMVRIASSALDQAGWKPKHRPLM